jgi:tungstate transport system substrate-binding protein
MLSVAARVAFIALLVAAALSACGGGKDELLLGATTSVQDPGLLDELVAAFEEDYDYDVKPIVQGSGQIIELARRGELDVIMTHSPGDEQKLLDEGIALERTSVMRNYFLLAGPESDPAAVAGASSLREAFRRIAESEAGFVSRGDGSGTHRRELATWETAGIDPAGESWYRESAAGQGQSVLVANDSDDYTLVDSSTFIALENRLQIIELFRDEEQPNVYSVLRLDSEELSEVNDEAAAAWIEFMTSERGQRVIDEYGREEYGKSLFEPLLLD